MKEENLLSFFIIKYKGQGYSCGDDDGDDDDVLAHVTDPTTLANVLPSEIRPLL